MTRQSPIANDTKLARAVVYLRVAARPDDSTAGRLLQLQRQICYHRTTELDAEVVGEYVDQGVSASALDRPGLVQMLDRLHAKRDVDYVIVARADRLTRRFRDYARIKADLDAAGVGLISASGPDELLGLELAAITKEVATS